MWWVTCQIAYFIVIVDFIQTIENTANYCNPVDMKIFQKGFRTPYTDYRCNRTRVIERFIQLWIDVEGSETLECELASHVIMCRDDFWVVQRYIVFIIVKGMMFIFCWSTALVLFQHLLFSLSQWLFAIFSHFYFIQSRCAPLAAQKVVNNRIYVSDQHTSYYTTLRRHQWGRDYIFLYLWCFICSSLCFICICHRRFS